MIRLRSNRPRRGRISYEPYALCTGAAQGRASVFCDCCHTHDVHRVCGLHVRSQDHGEPQPHHVHHAGCVRRFRDEPCGNHHDGIHAELPVRLPVHLGAAAAYHDDGQPHGRAAHRSRLPCLRAVLPRQPPVHRHHARGGHADGARVDVGADHSRSAGLRRGPVPRRTESCGAAARKCGPLLPLDVHGGPLLCLRLHVSRRPGGPMGGRRRLPANVSCEDGGAGGQGPGVSSGCEPRDAL